MKNIFVTVLMILFLSSASFAQNVTDQKNTPANQVTGVKHSHFKPSQVSIDACLGKSEGVSCTFISKKRISRTGICGYTKDQKYFFCKKSQPSK